MDLTFEWDEGKAASNVRKHKVSFEEAKTVFGDPFALTVHDPTHSAEEDRYVTIGRSSAGRVLVVVYTERGQNLRLITSRRAKESERRDYEEGTP
ncbi:MAG: BrnT family toxin [Planctomycetes bacterium]|nr:BrnT family toxin [Planctomycetota bacterium]